MRLGFRKGLVAAFLGIGLIGGILYHSVDERTINNDVSDLNRDLLRIAHRGASGYAPENTMAAFEKAYHIRADMIELDVQLSKDGQLVVIHDSLVNRTSSGKGGVHKMTLNQLRKLDAGSWYNSRFRGQKIPTLEDVLQRFGGKIPLLIEMKSSAANSGIERKLAELIQKYDQQSSREMKDTIIVQSFNIKSLQTFHKISPEIPIAVIVSRSAEIKEEQLNELAPFAQYLTVSSSLVTEEIVTRIQRTGMKVFVWNIQNLLDIPSYINAGVNGIITDYPDIVPIYVYERL
ncbi:glycerophosphodiester phosphodiesterase [Paenibacillus dakarensis]|uniref:glycerophosphodiester phosphodiesterase n=1 Tax=Paenibacillus dakarensis TaxID=1527293 RepID=UPI0006D56DA6|nr:glycerophosphodiester phosphodiesterase family protein [Paenibacillus dakarensis]